MRDILLEKLFEMNRWENAIETGVVKGIDKGELRKLTDPTVRAMLYVKIKTDSYEIAPPHQALIPKDKPGEFRTVYINENIDRIFLSIVNDMLFEMFPNFIHKSCKSYQKGTGCGKIVKQVSQNICDTKGNVIGWKSDLSKYFDTVPIRYVDDVFDRIENEVGKSKVIDVLRKYYHTDLCFDTDGNLISQYQSLKQGCAVASFLADAVLYPIDATLCDAFKGYYVRYSDDCLYIGEDYAKAMNFMKAALSNMEMTLNPKKVEYLTKNKWFKFLGFSICGDKISLSSGRIKTFQKEIEARTIKDRITPTKALHSVNAYLYHGDSKGHSWASNVLPIINSESDINELNKFVMDCLRAVETRKTKIGGLGYVKQEKGVVSRGVGRNVRSNREKTAKNIDGYMTLNCARNAILSSKEVYETLVRQLNYK